MLNIITTHKQDVSMWITPEFTENNLCEVVRSLAGDLVEEVKLIDAFTHPKTQRTSQCFRIAYRYESGLALL
jgi:phenylalanyl-tRNA synthetase alpha chain